MVSPLHHLGPVVCNFGFMYGLLFACQLDQGFLCDFGVFQSYLLFAMVWLALCLALGFWVFVSFSCFACSRMDFLVCFGLPRAHPRSFPVGCSPCRPSRVPTCVVRLFMTFALLRVGEAKVPGPCSEWKIGHCNPAGLPNKAHLFTDSDVDLWLVSESHLSSQGFRKFQHQMRDEHSPYRWHIPGKHVMPRSTTSDHGSWTGVLAMSTHPTRRLPHSWHPRIFDTSRIMASTTHCFGMWISGVVVYGVPGGPTHPNARASTCALIQEGINRVGAMSGPRYIAGDWNHDLDSLPCVGNLKEMQFVEVQDLHFQLTGCPPQPTCRGKTRRDFLFISPELIPMFQRVEINHHQWIDHASVIAQFRGHVDDLVRFPWPQPSPLPWTKVKNDDPGIAFSFADGDCTQIYQQFWGSVEQRALRGLADVGSLPMSKCVGRGRRLRPKRVSVQTGPVKAARHGEVDPSFFGISHLHRQWFRQLRRLQSMVRLLRSPSQDLTHVEHRCNLWRSILNARGFAPSFCEWWLTRPVIVHPNAVITSEVPSWQIVQLVFEDMQRQVTDLEKHLNSSRRSGCKATPAHALTALYRAVKRDAPAQVDVLFQTKQSTIREIVLEDEAIIVDPPQNWDENLPFVVQGVPVTPTYVTSDCLWLESTQSLEVGQVLTQTRGVGRLECVFEVFIDYWSKFWCKHADTPISHWNTILQFARERLPRVNVDPLNISVPLVRATLKSKKARSARGLDGVGRDDILNLTSNEMQSLVSLYNRAALTGEWPLQVVQGLVKSLAKKPDPMDAPDYRPISIFSVVYRLWSSLQSRFWLGCISNVLSSTLSGNRNGHQASTLWRRVLEEVEFGHSCSQSTCGLILDLTKAFNTLPRLPSLAMCMVCGMDSGTINAWAGALGLMTRRFWVNGSVSRAATADCGFPEGCGLSCFAMLVLTQAWHEWIRVSSMLPMPMSYVDNWEVVCTSPEAVHEAFTKTLDFARLLDLKVDAGKTVAWAVSATDRAHLRSQGFKVANDCRDLGAHVVFSKQLRNATVVRRFDELATFWTRLRNAPGTYQQKCRIIRTVAWPRCLHAISGSIVGKKHFHSLRSALVSSLQHTKPGANSFLLCWLSDLDPQLTSIICTIRDWRSLGDVAHKQVMLELLSSTVVEHDVGPNSLSQVLLQRIQVLGWTIDSDGLVRDALGCFHILHASWVDVFQRIQIAWQGVVGAQIGHRSDFTGFGSVDLAGTRHFLSSLGAYDAGVHRHNLVGMTLTNEHSCFWSDNGQVQCCFCDQKDSLRHRYWECPHSADLRELISPMVRDIVPSLPDVLTIRGWSIESSYQLAWQRYLCSLTDSIPHVPCPALTGDRFNIFTDGSCLWPSCPQYRLAAWGVTLAPGLTLEPSALDSQVLSAGVVPGLVQTAYRAELYAVMVAMTLLERWQCKGRIWLDCQSVLDRFQMYVFGGKRINPNGPHHDLWTEICRIVDVSGSDVVELVKVSAQTVWTGETPAALRWAIVHNSCVDRVAKLANQLRGEDVWLLWKRHSTMVHQATLVSHGVQQHQLAVHRKWNDGGGEAPRLLTPRAPRQGKVFNLVWENVTALLQMPDDFVAMVGHGFACKLHSWWHQLFAEGDVPGGWVSFAQLYLLFQMHSKHPGVIKTGRTWTDPIELCGCVPERFSFRLRSKWFRLALQQFWKCAGFRVGTACTRPVSSMLTCHIGCASVPVSARQLEVLDEWLRVRLPGVILSQGQTLDKVPVAWT